MELGPGEAPAVMLLSEKQLHTWRWYKKPENPRHEHPTAQFSSMGYRVQAVLLVSTFLPAPQGCYFPSAATRRTFALCYTIKLCFQTSDFVYAQSPGAASRKTSSIHPTAELVNALNPRQPLRAASQLPSTAAFVMRHSATLEEPLRSWGCFLCHTQSQNNMRWMAKRLAWKQDGYVQSLFVNQKWFFLDFIIQCISQCKL